MRYPSASADELTAPRSQLRVVSVDVQDGLGLYHIGDFDTLEAAHRAAMERAHVGSPVYIYDDIGDLIVRLGSWH
jgi:hypothetical protein